MRPSIDAVVPRRGLGCGSGRPRTGGSFAIPGFPGGPLLQVAGVVAVSVGGSLTMYECICRVAFRITTNVFSSGILLEESTRSPREM